MNGVYTGFRVGVSFTPNGMVGTFTATLIAETENATRLPGAYTLTATSFDGIAP